MDQHSSWHSSIWTIRFNRLHLDLLSLHFTSGRGQRNAKSSETHARSIANRCRATPRSRKTPLSSLLVVARDITMTTPLQSLVACGTKLWLDSVDPDEVARNRA